jgi:hypothetical protein
MAVKDVFTDKLGEFSWRKALTALSGLLFCAAVISFLFGAKELPQSYILIISGVFAFYFLKDRLSGDSPWASQKLNNSTQNAPIKPNTSTVPVKPNPSVNTIDDEIGNTDQKPS